MARSGTTTQESSSESSITENISTEPRTLDDVAGFPNRTTTPVESVLEDLWYLRILSEWCAAWDNVCDLWRRRSFWNKLYAIVSLFCLPINVVRKAASPHDEATVPDHASVSYFFLLMCYTFVINLIQLDKNNDVPANKQEYERQIRLCFVAGCMVLAIVAMLYIYLFTKDRVRHDPCHDAAKRIFFRGGLYLFGFVSVLNSVCVAINLMWDCDYYYRHSAATVHVLQAIFIVVETFFLGFFHKSCLPMDTTFLQISIAHILATNLALWFWTLCEEAVHVDMKNCTEDPLEWDNNTNKYFYPVFVEFLILAISMLYELWMNLSHRYETVCSFCQDCATCFYRSHNQAVSAVGNDEQASGWRQRYIPRCGYGITFGMIYVVLFIAVMLVAISHEAHLEPQANTTNFDTEARFKAYCYGSVVLYSSEMFACYIVLTSLRSSRNFQRIRSINYDDALLYISLLGILLLEGFHTMSKVLTSRCYWYVLAVDICGTFQHLTQVVTLMNLRHFGRASTYENKSWITECILFLLLTNIAWWIEDSFYLEPRMTRPGEYETIDGIDTYGYIVKPMVIFFRFHSATYFYNAWCTYRT